MLDIFDEIVSWENLNGAWAEFRVGKRKRLDVQWFERNIEDNLFLLREDLLSGTYRHSVYHQFHVFDPKHRVIHKATVRDRLVHHAVYRMLDRLNETNQSSYFGLLAHCDGFELEQYMRQRL